jgi:hypothetical protein
MYGYVAWLYCCTTHHKCLYYLTVRFEGKHQQSYVKSVFGADCSCHFQSRALPCSHFLVFAIVGQSQNVDGLNIQSVVGGNYMNPHNAGLQLLREDEDVRLIKSL